MRIICGLVVLLVCALPLFAELGEIPVGFTPIFNGKDLTGWHVSKTNHHGTTPEFRVVHGLIVSTQNPRGRGGILLTDKKYKNVEVYLEIWPDYGCDGGLFVRSNEAGHAYQIMLDYLPGGNIGGVYGERLEGVGGQRAATPQKLTEEERKKMMAKMRERNQTWEKHWTREGWNSIRVRIEGEAPHIQVWLNGEQITDFQDTANHAANGAVDGMLALQMHYTDEKTNRWVDGGFWRYRNIAVKLLPD